MKSKDILILYSFIVCLILSLAGILSAKNLNQLLSSLIYLPLVFYFGTRLFPTLFAKKKQPSPKKAPSTSTVLTPLQITTESKVMDSDKRLFLKLIGSTGFSLLLMALFTKKAQAAFFGSVPGPGTLSLKDVAGNKIDPAERQPTDGYVISQLDDISTPAYYGFVKKTGDWYILREESNGNYRYAKGGTNFDTNWTNRVNLSYDYFHNIF